GKSGSLVLPLGEFRRYYAAGTGGAQLWERQGLTRGRGVLGGQEVSREGMGAVGGGAHGVPRRPGVAGAGPGMRRRRGGSRGERDLKRGFGGIVDIEFLVQLLQLKYGRELPALRPPNTWQALEALRDAGLLGGPEYEALRAGYDFLLRVQARLRIVHNRSLDEVPGAPEEVEKLARRPRFGAPGGVLADLGRPTTPVPDPCPRAPSAGAPAARGG